MRPKAGGILERDSEPLPTIPPLGALEERCNVYIKSSSGWPAHVTDVSGCEGGREQAIDVR